MEGKFYAVIDTNVIVSAVISKSLESNPAKIIRATRNTFQLADCLVPHHSKERMMQDSNTSPFSVWLNPTCRL